MFDAREASGNNSAAQSEYVIPFTPVFAGLIQQSNGRLPQQLAPLRTQAVRVGRGSEAALHGGRATVDFAAGLMSVATLLAG